MTEKDIPAVIALQKRVFPSMPGWNESSLQSHLSIFPEGQWVAVDDAGRLVGSASSLIIDWDDYAESAKWWDITGNGTFSTHNPLGKTLYGADMGVDPDSQGCGIGSLFYGKRKEYIREKGLKRMLVGGRIPGYSEVSREMTAREYVAEVTMGKRKDPTLSFQLKNDLIVLDVIEDYLEDPKSHGFATLLEWLNPEYQASLGLHTEDQITGLPEVSPAAALLQKRRVRIAAVQYLLRPIASFADFESQVEFFVRSARAYRCHYVLFPEFFSMQILSYLRDSSPGRAVRRLAELTTDFEDLFQRLSRDYQLYLVAGTHPVIQEGKLFNVAHLFTPSGRVFRQKKVHLTAVEKGPYHMSRGHGFYLFHTEHAKIAVLVCYDVEFPEAARVLAEAGAEILFVPSCTDDRQGFYRVRYCSQARAIENQIYVVMTGTVGNLPQVPYMSTHYGQASILTPSDHAFSRDGVAAEGTANQEQIIVSEVDLDLLKERREDGTVLPLQDLIKDAYDRVIHQVDSSTP
jgi:predicted amidohydrolase/GNAT superfamily N-acetyltransferase